MLKNYLIVALRQLRRNLLFSSITIFCLSIGITFSLLIGVYILHETHVNAYIGQVDRQYLMKCDWKQKAMGSDIMTFAGLPVALTQQYPQLVSGYYRFGDFFCDLVAGNRHVREDCMIGDSSLERQFDFPVLYGDYRNPFPDGHAIILTQSLAEACFGKKDAVGQSLRMTTSAGTTYNLTVSLVLKDAPDNSVMDIVGNHHPMRAFVSYKLDSTFGLSPGQVWTDQACTYLTLQPGVRPEALDEPMARLLKEHLPPTYQGQVRSYLQPMKTQRLDENNGAVRKLVRSLALIALFILLLAVVNFVNIKIGTSEQRMKEAALRKVFGGARRQLIVQHLCESMLLVLFSTALSLGFYELLRPLSVQILSVSLEPVSQFRFSHWLFLGILALGVGLLAGLYPAFVLSATAIIRSLKGVTLQPKGGLWLRKTLLVIQFTVALVVMICAWQISLQIRYFLDKDLGYTKAGVMVIQSLPFSDGAGPAIGKLEALRSALGHVPGVGDASLSWEIPDGHNWDMLNLIPEGASTNQVLSIPYLRADEHFAAAYGLHLTRGRFLRHEPFDTSGFVRPDEIVLNESAVKAFGWKDALGKRVRLAFGGFDVTVVGVVKDFAFGDLRQRMGPVGFLHLHSFPRPRHLSIRLAAGQPLTRTVASVERVWKSFYPDRELDYAFMDDTVKGLYASELQLQAATRMASVMCLVIVFLGIFGVVTFTLARRIREIAIRKVLGAGVLNIINLFIKEYALLLVISILLAWPLAHALIARWLDEYAYRINQTIWPFAGVALVLGGTTFLLVGWQTGKAATTAPSQHLRNE